MPHIEKQLDALLRRFFDLDKSPIDPRDHSAEIEEAIQWTVKGRRFSTPGAKERFVQGLRLRCMLYAALVVPDKERKNRLRRSADTERYAMRLYKMKEGLNSSMLVLQCHKTAAPAAILAKQDHLRGSGIFRKPRVFNGLPKSYDTVVLDRWLKIKVTPHLSKDSSPVGIAQETTDLLSFLAGSIISKERLKKKMMWTLSNGIDNLALELNRFFRKHGFKRRWGAIACLMVAAFRLDEKTEGRWFDADKKDSKELDAKWVRQLVERNKNKERPLAYVVRRHQKG